MAVKKHKLNVSFNNDLKILGISSTLDELKLCWEFNQALGVSFKLDTACQIERKNRRYDFVRYTFYEDDELWKYNLIINRNSGNVLFSEFKTIDYILLIQGEFSNASYISLFEKLKQISNISAVVKIEVEGLKTLRKINL